MANGKDAFSYALSRFIFSSIEFFNEEIKSYWENIIPDLDKIPTDTEINNPAQRVKLVFGNKKFSSEEKSPKVVIINEPISFKHTAKIILEASSGEDCARLLAISHTIAQRFSIPIYLIISIECLNENLNFKPEHIPFPPKYIIREQSWKPDEIYPNHPALSFKRINYGSNKGPRDKAKILIISHGKYSLFVNNLIKESKHNIRHLEIQTLRPLSKEILNQAMTSVQKTICINETYTWIKENESIDSLSLNDLNNLIS
ncbi:MAG: hypothetical protein CMB48_04480 [Euryarchaeota archaeon]|nr:hypothetical protein [Euryarchaeota archaeon]|tara:strand:- start:6283 stop:7056 length:774 start_codon:yes stop_codon:yes gene_type:complete